MLRIYSTVLIFALAVFSFSCEKTTAKLDENNKWIYTSDTATGFIKFIHAYTSPAPALTTGAGPSVQIYMDATRLSGGAIGYNGTVPSPGGVYSVVATGSHTFYQILNRLVSSVFTPTVGDTVVKNTATIEAGKYYSMFLVDTFPTPGVLTVMDNITIPSPGTYNLRYVNVVTGSSDAYDVYSIREQKNLFTNVGNKKASEFVSLPIREFSDTLIVRLAGTMTLLDSLKAPFTPVPQRSYTVYTRGKTNVVGKAPATTYYTNR